jgi:hypothetical protein
VTKANDTMACPACGTELTPVQMFTHEDTQRAFARLAAVSVPLGARVLSYITLFAPPKTRLTIAKQVKLILQLLPDLERQAITWKGREWAAPLGAWQAAFEQMEAARQAGRLDLPMQGHGYLYAVLAGVADKAEARSEQDAENARRTAQGRDPALAKADQSVRAHAAVPDHVRDLQRRLREGKGDAS